MERPRSPLPHILRDPRDEFESMPKVDDYQSFQSPFPLLGPHREAERYVSCIMTQLGYKDKIYRLSGTAKILYMDIEGVCDWDLESLWLGMGMQGRVKCAMNQWNAGQQLCGQDRTYYTPLEVTQLMRIGSAICNLEKRSRNWSSDEQRRTERAEAKNLLYKDSNQLASQRAGQRREARKVRAAQEQAQGSRSAVEVSDATLRAVEARTRALELAAAASAAGQGSSGRRAPTPPPVRTAEEEAAEEAAREDEKKEEAARLRNEKADAKKKEQEEWLAKQRANKKGKGKAKVPAAAPTERAPSRPRERVDYEQAAREALEDGPRRGNRRG